ncbi:VOC family protein [Nocardioides humilatus]|uniref:VOC family protein n=1 Tax=Nocardioides humilatus TaxID=2607660 RepID=A0A5B1L8W8_9ACTN|nr:VOC family protein [Nocardioides humilatus]KAA1417035.1 VOC family protein [Nocardioides humilatus]
MPTRDEAWPHGTPNWVDLAADDTAAAAKFYSELLGWRVDAPTDDAAGGYMIATKDDRPVAGIGPKPMPDMPSNWATYIAADSADATAKAIKAAGGTLHMDPFDVETGQGKHGRMFFATATDGSTFGVWEAANHIGANLYNEPGALSWNELHSRDLAKGKAFYSEVFGYEFDDMSGPEFTYLIFKRPGEEQGVGGMGTDAMLPEGVPSVWLTWFAVDSCDAAVAKVAELGGEVRMELGDSPFGRMAVVAGPQGEVFGVIGLSEAQGEMPG